MKKFVALLAAVIAVPASAATSVNFNGGSGALPTDVTVFQDFESFANGASLGTNAFVFSAPNGNAARPANGSTGNFGAVLTGGSYTVSFAATNVFSFVLGSLDTYNTLTLRYADGSSQAYAGGQIINDLTFPSGDQVSGQTNGVVTYRVTSGPKLTGATFASSANSFEFDNLAAGAVPEPATWAMMIGGFGLIGAASRRRARVSTVLA